MRAREARIWLLVCCVWLPLASVILWAFDPLDLRRHSWQDHHVAQIALVVLAPAIAAAIRIAYIRFVR